MLVLYLFILLIVDVFFMMLRVITALNLIIRLLFVVIFNFVDIFHLVLLIDLLNLFI